MGETAILHKQLTGVGGAQHVAYELARGLDAPIYAAWVDQDVVPDDVEAVQLFGDTSRRLTDVHYTLRDSYMMLAFQHLPELYDYDRVVVNQTTGTWFVPREDQRVVQYAHHPPRSQYDMWHRRDPSLLSTAVATAQRVLYRPTMDYPDAIIANSETTARRFRKYFNIEVDAVVHPPVDTSHFDPDECVTGDYYLSLSRLEPNKRVVEIVEAFEEEGVPLVVAGTGSEGDSVRDAAGRHTEVVGHATEDQKIQLMSGARGFVMNAEQEDYGMTPVEAMASGTPVLGVDEGYTPRHITEGVNGVVYRRGELGAAIRRAERTDWDENRIAASAERRIGFVTEIEEALDDS